MCVLLYNTKIRNNGWKLVDSNTVPGDDVLWFLFFRFKFGEKIPLYCFARVTIQTLLGKLEMLVYNRIYFKKMVHLTLIQLTMKHWYLY